MIYNYLCTSCGDMTERVLKISEYMLPTTQACPKCGEMTVEKRTYCMPPLVDPTKLGRVKNSEEFRNVLENISKKVYKSDFSIR